MGKTSPKCDMLAGYKNLCDVDQLGHYRLQRNICSTAVALVMAGKAFFIAESLMIRASRKEPPLPRYCSQRVLPQRLPTA